MTSFQRVWALAAMTAAASLTQTPPVFFELELPDFQQTLAGGNVVADMPVRPIVRMKLQLLGSAATNLGYGDVRIRINGKGAGNLFNSGSNARGKFFAMDPSTLRMRPDQVLDPSENAVEIYGRDVRGRTYYQNWILRAAKANLNPYFSYVSSISPADESGLAPDLNLEQPAAPVFPPAGAGSKPFSVRIKGSASAASGLASLTFNGKPAKAQLTGLSVDFDESLVVGPGDHTIVAEATDKKGNRRTVSIPVQRPTQAAPKVKMAGQSIALIIGISRFSAAAGAPPALPAAAYQAKELAEELQRHGFQKENVRLLVDEQATVEQIRTALLDFTAKAKPEDFLLIYFATQGLHDPGAPENVYLAAGDTSAQKLRVTALEIAELQLLLNRSIRSRHALLFFDAEHQLGAEWGFRGKSIVNTFLLNLFDAPQGRSVIVSGRPGQDSATVDTGGTNRSLFSAALIDGLGGKADVDRNGVVTARELCAYVADSVRRATNGVEIPEFRYPPGEAELPVLSLK